MQLLLDAIVFWSVITRYTPTTLEGINLDVLEAKFGEAGKTVVIEEFLSGIELSVFVLTDGKHYKIFTELHHHSGF